MQRLLEPELMLEPDQVKAYAEADFDEPNSAFIKHVQYEIPVSFNGSILDLGCGPGEISYYFADTYLQCTVDAVDGSAAMLDYARLTLSGDLQKRITFLHKKIPTTELPLSSYDLIISNSLLHHLPDPHVLWQTIKRFSTSGTQVCIMDLFRPDSKQIAADLVKQYAENEAEILQHDFYHSLLAAFTLDEIKQQLQCADLNFIVQQCSDRHVYINGKIN